MKRPSSYKVTFLDKHGPAGMHLVKAGAYAVVVGVFGAIMFAFLAYKLGITGILFFLFTLGGGVTLGWAAAYVGLASGQAAADIAQYVTAGGSGTPYEESFSQEQALVMQRDYATALELFEQRIIQAPGEPCVRIAAADLYRTYGENPKRAAELYREVQRIPEVMSGHDIYVSNKLADLYFGPLKEPGKALVEFRRLIERYPGSVAADHARLALANLKSDVMKEGKEEAPPYTPW